MATADRVDAMIEPDFLRFDTLSLHAGQQPDPTTGARAVPLYFTTSYVFDDSDHAAGLFNLEMPGHLYSRLTNPTVAVLEERLAALEGGVGAVCTASGQAAFFLAVVTLMGQGGHIVASRNIYGGTHQMLNVTLPRLGITTTFVDPRDPQASRTPSPTRPASSSPRPSATPVSRSSTSQPSPRWRTVTGSR